MTFDLSKFELKDTADIEIELPNGSPMMNGKEQVVISVYGGGSKQYVSAKHRAENAASLRVSAMLRNKSSRTSAEETAKEQAQFLADCTAEVKGLPITALEIYSNPKLKYITDQVQRFLDDDENFMQG